eukprot:scaffold68365_cov63-Phaeocystis_antarctica.AAC.7
MASSSSSWLIVCGRLDDGKVLDDDREVCQAEQARRWARRTERGDAAMRLRVMLAGRTGNARARWRRGGAGACE